MRKRVLVVDDDPLILLASRRTLERAGFDVTAVGTAAHARAVLPAPSLDVALVDYFLGPGECGCELIAPLRAHHPAIRIAILSGLGVLPELIRRAYQAGADLVASKTHIDWVALASGDALVPGPIPSPIQPDVDLAALKRDVIHGTYLVHRRNVSRTARALGMKRSSLQRVLRKTPPPDLGEE
jgi:ActR/RegA family two-component response regulator